LGWTGRRHAADGLAWPKVGPGAAKAAASKVSCTRVDADEDVWRRAEALKRESGASDFSAKTSHEDLDEKQSSEFIVFGRTGGREKLRAVESG
jgi:hypothetical protein